MIESQLRLKMGNFEAAYGWLDRLGKWHDISCKCMDGRVKTLSNAGM